MSTSAPRNSLHPLFLPFHPAFQHRTEVIAASPPLPVLLVPHENVYFNLRISHGRLQLLEIKWEVPGDLNPPFRSCWVGRALLRFRAKLNDGSN